VSTPNRCDGSEIATARAAPLRQIDEPFRWSSIDLSRKPWQSGPVSGNSTGRDMADDLRHYLESEVVSLVTAARRSEHGHPTAHIAQGIDSPVAYVGTIRSEARAVKILPKGATIVRTVRRRLLPPRATPRARENRDGLPQVLVFWKTRI